VAATVIADGGADFLRNGVQVLEQVFDREFLQVGIIGQSLVELGDVGLVMLAMVDFHGLGIDVRLQRVEGVSQRRQLVGARGGLGEGPGRSRSHGQSQGTGRLECVTSSDHAAIEVS